jgi:hypothetical protein
MAAGSTLAHEDSHLQSLRRLASLLACRVQRIMAG